MSLVIYPIHLFEFNKLKSIIDKYNIKKIIINEHPVFYGKRDIQMNFNKKKLIYQKATTLYYYDYIKQYIPTSFGEGSADDYHLDPMDNLIRRNIKKIIDHPMFLLISDDIKEHQGTSHYWFHKWWLNKMNIKNLDKSLDKLNRNPPDAKMYEILSEIPKFHMGKIDMIYIKKAIKYVNEKYPKNIGDVNLDDFIFPITHESAKKFLNHFLRYKFKYFGTYQDSISKTHPFLFHSMLSPLLNVGLITPADVIKKATAYYTKHNIPKQSYEGFIRQLGWREFERYIYDKGFKITSINTFGNSKKELWYSGIGIPPVDDSIHIAFKYGYLHHIARLMIMANYMNLKGIHPDYVYRWFMEFSCDSYDWVMVGNVYSMGMWDGGVISKRPYISSSKYIIRMSDYEKGKWCDEWDATYNSFIKRNEKKLKGTIYSMSN